MPRALPLITCNPTTGNFAVDADTITVLSTVTPPIAVVSIAGLFRTGKSFLLNRVILNSPTTGRRARKTPPSVAGFGVGSTVQAHTKGIWVWSDPIVVRNSQGVDVNVLVMDTEGAGAPTADATHDARISSLGLLLSSYFVYNSVGRIDDAALSALSTITHVTSEMRVEDAGTLPGFLWVLRDFALQLQNREGIVVDADTYMEEQLAGDRNDARSHLRTYFPDRGCATLVRPVTDETDLQNLSKLGDASLRPEFLDAAAALRTRVFTATANRPLTHDNTLLSGSMLATLASRYVDAVNAGAVPHIADAWEAVCAVRAAEAERDLMATFPSQLETLLTTASVDANMPVGLFQTQVSTLLDSAWTSFLACPGAKPRLELRTLLEEQCATTMTRYEVKWTERVRLAAVGVVDTCVAASRDGTVEWADFWTVVGTQRAAFEVSHGTGDATTLILLRAMYRLWELVPSFLVAGGAASRVAELETALSVAEESARSHAHDMADLQLRLEGATRRATGANDEMEEMSRGLAKAQAELQGVLEEAMETPGLRAEVSALTTRVLELEDSLAGAEDEAARKAAEAHTTALKSVEAVKELRAVEAKRYEADMAATTSAAAAAAEELVRVTASAEAAATRARTAEDRVVELSDAVATARSKADTATREAQKREDTVRTLTSRVAELERTLADAEERARKRPRVDDGDALALVRATTELRFLRKQKTELDAALATAKARVTELERQIRAVQRTADDTVQRERLMHETALAQMEMRFKQ